MLPAGQNAVNGMLLTRKCDVKIMLSHTVTKRIKTCLLSSKVAFITLCLILPPLLVLQISQYTYFCYEFRIHGLRENNYVVPLRYHIRLSGWLGFPSLGISGNKSADNSSLQDHYKQQLIRFFVIHRTKKRWRLYILPQYLANRTKLTAHIERYGLTAVVPILTALLLSSLNDLQYFFVFLYAPLAFSGAKQYR